MAEIRKDLFIRDLGDGLVLRHGCVEDTEPLAAFNANVHRDDGSTEPSGAIAAWSRDLSSRPHPSFTPADFTIVEDTRTGAIVSSLNLFSQMWCYGGIDVPAGRPEAVGTAPAYRRRGLVRAQMDEVHRWSAARGELIQGISGIPNYYRQFGYEMAVDLGGGRVAYAPHVPKLKPGESEPYRVRRVAEADLPFIAETYDHARRRYLLSCVRDLASWRYELSGRSAANINRTELRLIETPAGEPVGYLMPGPRLHGGELWVGGYEVKPGLSWLGVTPSVLRYLQATGAAYAAHQGEGPCHAISFSVTDDHPVCRVAGRRLPQHNRTYAWFMRVPDLPAFLRRVAPVLEGRLLGSPVEGHTGELRLSFYRSGLTLGFEGGKLARAESYRPEPGRDDSAAFPGLTFLQLLLGWRTLEEIEHAFPDAWAGDDARALLPILFPKQPSSIWPVS